MSLSKKYRVKYVPVHHEDKQKFSVCRSWLRSEKYVDDVESLRCGYFNEHAHRLINEACVRKEQGRDPLAPEERDEVTIRKWAVWSERGNAVNFKNWAMTWRCCICGSFPTTELRGLVRAAKCSQPRYVCLRCYGSAKKLPQSPCPAGCGISLVGSQICFAPYPADLLYLAGLYEFKFKEWLYDEKLETQRVERLQRANERRWALKANSAEKLNRRKLEKLMNSEIAEADAAEKELNRKAKQIVDTAFRDQQRRDALADIVYYLDDNHPIDSTQDAKERLRLLNEQFFLRACRRLRIPDVFDRDDFLSALKNDPNPPWRSMFRKEVYKKWFSTLQGMREGKYRMLPWGYVWIGPLSETEATKKRRAEWKEYVAKSKAIYLTSSDESDDNQADDGIESAGRTETIVGEPSQLASNLYRDVLAVLNRRRSDSAQSSDSEYSSRSDSDEDSASPMESTETATESSSYSETESDASPYDMGEYESDSTVGFDEIRVKLTKAELNKATNVIVTLNQLVVVDLPCTAGIKVETPRNNIEVDGESSSSGSEIGVSEGLLHVGEPEGLPDDHNMIEEELSTSNKQSCLLPSKPGYRHACPDCNKTYITRSGLWQHCKTIGHTLPGFYRCGTCEKSFDKPWMLTEHQILVHSEGSMEAEAEAPKKKFNCVPCGLYGLPDYIYEKHVRVHHPGVSPFICKFCRKAFMSRLGVARHEKRFHPQLPLEPYVCGICKSTYSWKSALIRHIKGKHEPRVDTSS